MALSLDIPEMKQTQEIFNGFIARVMESSLTALIRDFIQHGKFRQALNVYQKALRDDIVDFCRETFVGLLKACTKLKDVATGCKLHLQIASTGLLETNLFTSSSLVDMYARCGLLATAGQVFRKLPSRDAVTWTALIAGCVEHGCAEEALKCFEQMQVDGVLPDAVAFVYSLKACSSIGAIGKGEEIHAQIETAKLHGREDFIGSALIDMYVKFGLISKAEHVFYKLPFRDAISWTTLMAGFVEHGYNEEALKCFKQLQLEGISPDAHIYVCCLQACGNLTAINKGQELHIHIEKEGILDKDIFLGNTLVDMYAKVGSLDRAQQAFDKLPVRDVVSWTTLISSFMDHGAGEEALHRFDHMQLEGVCPNAVTYVCALKACGSIGDVDKGSAICEKLDIEGLVTRELIVGNALVDMYAKCGFLSIARQVFDKLLVKDIVSWTTMIAGYAEHGHGEEALILYDAMQIEGISSNALTFVCILKACGSTCDLGKGLQVHALIEKTGLAISNHVVAGTLVDMYAKCGSLDNSQRMFEMLPARDMVSWTMLMAGFVEHGHGEEALGCFEQMQWEGISLDAFTYVCSLRACGTAQMVDYGQAIHAEVERKGLLEQDDIVGTTLVDMYLKCNLLSKAQEVFEELPSRGIISWNTLMTGFVEEGHSDKALEYLEHMHVQGVLPNDATLVNCLDACANVGAPKKGQALHSVIEHMGLLERDFVMGNAMVFMYGKCGLLSLAQTVFHKLPLRETVTWNALIAGYAEYGMGNEAIERFEQMQLQGSCPDAVTMVCALKACGCLETTTKGQEIHAQIETVDSFVKDIFVSSALIDMYAKCGMLGKAQQVFDKYDHQNVVMWTALIAGYMTNGHFSEALECFEQMKLEGIAPNEVTLSCGLRVCANVGAIDQGLQIHHDIERTGLAGRDLAVGNTLVDMYAKCGSVDVAQHVFDNLMARNMESWNALLAGYAQMGQSDVVFHVFNQMLEEDLEPDPAAFHFVLKSCTLAGLFDLNQTYFDSLCKHYNIVPTLEHKVRMVDLLSRAGQLEKALAMIERMPFCPDFLMWHSVLSACRRYGHVEVGEQAFEHGKLLSKKDVVVYM